MLVDIHAKWRDILIVLGSGVTAILLATTVLVLPPKWIVWIGSAGIFLMLLLFGKARVALMALTGASVLLDSFTDVSIFQLSSQANINIQGSLSLLLLLGFFFYVLTRRTRILSWPLVWPWLAFLLATTLSFFVSPNLIVSMREFVRLIAIFAVFLLAAESSSEDQDGRLFIAFLFGITLIQLFLGFFQWARQVGLNENSLITPGFFRIQGTFWHPSSYGSFLHIPILVSLALLSLTQKPLVRGILNVNVVLLILSLFLTYTRTAWISIAVAVGVYSYLRSRKLLIILFLVALLSVMFLPQLMARFEDLQTLEWRMEQYRMYGDLFLHKPVTGYGLGVTVEIGGLWTIRDVHNDYLRMAVETGIGGFIAYLGLIAACGWQGLTWFRHAYDERSKAFAAAFIAVTIGYFIFALTSNILRNTVVRWLYWEFAGLISFMNIRNQFGAKR